VFAWRIGTPRHSIAQRGAFLSAMSNARARPTLRGEFRLTQECTRTAQEMIGRGRNFVRRTQRGLAAAFRSLAQDIDFT
jgi:hypothetical protein